MISSSSFRSLLLALPFLAACGGTAASSSGETADAAPKQVDAGADSDAMEIGDRTAGHCNDLELPTDVLSMTHPETLDSSPGGGGSVPPGTYDLTAIELVDQPAQPGDDTRFGNARLRVDGRGGLQWVRVRDDGQVRRSAYALNVEGSMFTATESCGFPLLVNGATEKLSLRYAVAGRTLTLFFPAGKTGTGTRVEHYTMR